MNDEELVAGLKRGDLEAQISLLNEYLDKLIDRLLYRFPTIDEGDIEEIAADTIYYVITKPSYIDLSKSKNGKIWNILITIAWRKALDLFKKQRAALINNEIVRLDSLNTETTVDGVSVTHWQDDRFHNEEAQESKTLYPPELVIAAHQMIEALNLTEEELDHIRLRLVEKLQPKEIATLMGITADNEGVRWHRLMKKIEKEWVKHPTLLEYSRRQGLEIPGA